MIHSRWRAILLGLLCFSFFFGTAIPGQAQKGPLVPTKGKRLPRPSAHPFRYVNSILVRFHDVKDAGGKQAAALKSEVPQTQTLDDAELIRRDVPPMTRLKQTSALTKLGVQLYQLTDSARRDEALAKLRKMPEVRYAEAVQRIHSLSLPDPNDTYYNLIDDVHALDPENNRWLYEWEMHLIQVKEAWEVWPGKYYTAANKPRNAPKIAVIDTGIDTLHNDFKNAGGSSVDAAQGGQLDLTDAYDFASDTTDPTDENGHGTHVSGVAGAATNNGFGIVGIGYPAQIMSLKVTDSTGDGDDVDAIDALTWAADHGAVVVNISLALDGGYSQALQDGIDYCWSKNTLIVAAAGNDGVDYVRRYPAACDKVLAVAATSFFNDQTIPAYETIASYSNSGLYIGICAPGGDATYWISTGEFPIGAELYTQIWSTTPSNTDAALTAGDPPITSPIHGYLNGTSMASPHAAGLAILYAAAKNITQATPNAPQKIVRAIQRGADNIAGRNDGGWSFQYGYGRINAYSTVRDVLGLDRPSNTPGGITGQVTYYGTPLINASLSMKGPGRKKYIGSSKEDGTYRIPNVPAGVYTLTCKYQNILQTRSLTVEAGCDVMATDFAMETGSNVTITINPKSATLPLNGTQQFTASVTGNADINVTWTVSAGPGTISASGKYTAPASGTTPATVTIQAASVADPTKTDTATIYLLPTPKTLTFDPGSVNGGANVTATLKLTGPAPAGGATVTLSSANAAVAAVPGTVVIAAGSDTGTFTVTTTTVAADTSVNITAAYGGASLTSALTVKKASAGTAIRINCGGPLYTASNNTVFAKDVYYLDGSAFTRAATITGTTDQTLYQTLRSGAPFNYSIPVANGTYAVKLYFSETYNLAFGIGKRVMEIKINGISVFPALDIFAEAGANAALIKSSSVTVTNGKIDISFLKKAGNSPTVNAIEILP